MLLMIEKLLFLFLQAHKLLHNRLVEINWIYTNLQEDQINLFWEVKGLKITVHYYQLKTWLKIN